MPEFLIPIMIVAVPTLTSALYQVVKKHWLKFLDRFPASVQRFFVATGTAAIGAVAAHFGADLTGVAPDSVEGITVIVMQVLASFGVYNVAVQPMAAKKAEA